MEEKTIELSGMTGSVAWIISWLDQKAGITGIIIAISLIVILALCVWIGKLFIIFAREWFALVRSQTEVNLKTAHQLESMTLEIKDSRRALDAGLNMEREVYETVKRINKKIK